MKYTQFITHSTEHLGGEKCDAYDSVEIAESEKALEGEKLADHSYILRVMGHLLGKVLTTVEASTSDKGQAKAIKDLMRSHFSQEMEFVGSMMFDQTVLGKMAEESLEELEEDEITSVSVDEILGVEEN